MPEPAWDREGGVLCCQVADGPSLTVCNGYAPNGIAKPYWNHDLGEFDGDRSAFRLRFQARLLAELRALEPPLLLLGDWNVSRSKLDVYPRLRSGVPHALARAMWNEEFIPCLDLVDVFREPHPDARAFTWFSRQAAKRQWLGAGHVDYALRSRALQPRVLRAEITQEHALRLGSARAPITVELQTNADQI